MRILHLLASADRRGAEVFGTDLAAGLDEQGHVNEVVALAPACGPGGLDHEVLEALRRPGDLVALRRRAARSDVVIGHGSRGLVASTAATVGGSTPFVYRSIGDPGFWGSSRLRRLRVGAQLRRAEAVTALWPAARHTLIDRYALDPDRVHVVPNAADATRFRPPEPGERHAARAALDLDDGAKVVLALGALSPEKRVPLTIAATAAVDGAVLVVAGDGPERDVVATAAASALDGRHHLLGSVDDVVPLLHAADVLVLPSTTEGQPGVAIEAALCGLPVVATDVGGLASVVVPGRTGVLVDPDVGVSTLAVAIERALDSGPELAAMAIDHARAHFTVAAVAERWDALLSRHGRT